MPAAHSASKAVRRAVLASVIGQALEWYDFFLYGTASALVFGKLFFPVGKDPLVNTLAAFAGFAVGFVARPVGGVLCGHLGDRYGRKSAMMLILMTMGIATLMMGLLPTYQQIGIAAPIVLVVLRLFQGLAAGGEWNGSILIICESAPRDRRGYFSAWSPAGAALGFVLSTAAFLMLQRLTPDQFLRWGWRLPFLFSVVLIAVGAWVRISLPETADFERAAVSERPRRLPMIEVLRSNFRSVLLVFGLRLGEGGASFLFFSFVLVYGQFIHLPTSLVLTGLIVSMLLLIPVALFAGWLTDRVGRKPVYIAGTAGIVLYAYPFFALLNTLTPWVVIAALVIANSVVVGVMEGAQPVLIAELLPVHLRFSGLGIGREVASMLGAGIAPGIATALLIRYRSATPIAIYLAVLGSVSVITACFTPEPTSSRAVETSLNKLTDPLQSQAV